MTLLNWVYESCENAAKARQRIEDLTLIAAEYNMPLKLERVRIIGKHGGFNINATLNTEQFSTYEDAQAFFRAHCIVLRRHRREDAAAELELATSK